MAKPHRIVYTAIPLLVALVLSCAPPEPSDVPTPDPGSAVHSLSPGEQQVRRERIRAYFQDRQRRRPVIAVTRNGAGQLIDWIRPKSQVPGGVLAAPPPIALRNPAPTAPVSPITTAAPGNDLPVRPVHHGLTNPANLVPVVRFDVEEFLRSGTDLPEDPADVLKKLPAPAPTSNSRYYGAWSRLGTVYGSKGFINIWDTVGPTPSVETSIAQVAVLRGSPMQGVEAGKIELKNLNGGAAGPHFFTFYRTNGGATGDWVGGYNTLVQGWIQVSSRVAPGMSLAGYTSVQGGSQYSLDVEVRLYNGNWWVWAAGEWAGYYPYCRGGGTAAPCASGTLFSSSGIRDQADRLDWYGEVFDATSPSSTYTDMGSGLFAAEGWGKAAYFRNLTYYWAPGTYWWWDKGSPAATDANCYTTTGPYYSTQDAWHNWFYYGGPGKDASACR